jgi:hypothetical protein
LELTGLCASVLYRYSFQVFFDEIGGRGVRGPGPFTKCARVQVGTAPLLIRAIALSPTMEGCANCKRAGPRSELGCRCAVKTTPWMPRARTSPYSRRCEAVHMPGGLFSPARHVLIAARIPGPLSCLWQLILDAVGKMGFISVLW